jgi:hypothetical protein
MAENRTRSSPTKRTTKKSASKKAPASGGDTTKKASKRTSSRTTRKSPQKTARKTSRKTADDGRNSSTDPSTDGARKTAKASAESPPASFRRTQSQSMPRAAEVTTAAVQQLRELLGHGVESVTAVERDDDGWRVEVEVVELERVPQTTDVMAGYLVQLDESGDLMGYRRVRRYVRGSTEEGS